MSSEDNKTNQPSTLGSFIEQAQGAVQSVLGSIVGNPTDQKQGEDHKANAEAKDAASHAAAKVGPYTLSSTGAVAKDSSDRTQGSWNQNVGAAKEAVGGFVGSENLKQQGIEQNRQGQGQQAAGQLNDLGSGLGDRIAGTVGGAYANLTGDTVGQEKRQAQHDVGKSLQRGVEHDLQKEADAQHPSS